MSLKCKINLCPHKPVHAGAHIRTWSGFWGHQYLVHFQWRTFHFFIFYFLFFACTKTQKRKEANKLLFSSQMFFKRIFYFCSLISVLCFCLVAFLCFLVFFDAFGSLCAFCAFCALSCFLVFFVRTKSFRKKKV